MIFTPILVSSESRAASGPTQMKGERHLEGVRGHALLECHNPPLVYVDVFVTT